MAVLACMPHTASNTSWFPDARCVDWGDRMVGTRHPVYVTGEIGINHNGARPVGHRA
jgi:hypothetical protein